MGVPVRTGMGIGMGRGLQAEWVEMEINCVVHFDQNMQLHWSDMFVGKEGLHIHVYKTGPYVHTCPVLAQIGMSQALIVRPRSGCSE